MRVKGRAAVLISALLFGAHVIARADDARLPQSIPDFDQLMQKWGGTIPFPPQKLVESLTQLDPNMVVNAAIFPHGRSLERDATDFQSPRTVFTYQVETSDSTLDSLTFIAYTPNKRQLEIISFNSKTKEYDFRLATNYGPGLKPAVVDAPRAACMACHQQGGPIFPESNWSETQQNDVVLKKLQNQKNLEPFSKWLLSQPQIDAQGNRHSSVALAPGAIEFSVIQSEHSLRSSRVCKEVCGDDLDCKKTLVAGELFGSDPSGGGVNGYMSKNFNAIVRKNFDRIDIPQENIIPNRDISDGNYFKFSEEQDPLNGRIVDKVDYGSFIRNPALILGLTDCFDLQLSLQSIDPRLVALRKDPEKIRRAIDSSAMTDLIRKEWPPTRDEILKVVQDSASSNACVDAGSAPLSLAQTTQLSQVMPTILSLQQQPPLNLYRTYCAACHVGNIAPKLPLDDLSKLKTYVGVGNNDRTVLNLLTRRIMPPADFPIQPSPENRQEMIDAVKSAQ